MIGNFMKKNFPNIWKFIGDFFKGMTNNKEGHSLRKWLAVGFFWLTCVLCIRYTDSTNLVMVIGILTGMITALVITYSVANVQERKLDAKIGPPKDDNPPV